VALSNIFREPRREITETLVGLLVIGILVASDTAFGVWLHAHFMTTPVELGMLLGLFFGGAIISVFVIFHNVGEDICNWLERNGVYLRPRNRKK
jgi:hypothetical protein